MTKSIWEAKQKIAFIESLKRQLEALTDDVVAIRDTIEGELEAGEFEGIIGCLLNARAEEKAVVAGRKNYIETLEAANAAAEARAEKIKEMIGTAMRAASKDKYQGALGTVSFGSGRDQVIIDDASQLPVRFFKPVVDKTLVNEEALKIEAERRRIQADVLMPPGEQEARLAMLSLPGVRVVRGPDVLTIRAPSGGAKKRGL